MKIDGLFAGKVSAFGKGTSKSAIMKNPVTELDVFFEYTEQDEQANLKLHGGPEKVLHQFGLQNYAIINNHFAQANATIGSIGENISVLGMHDDNVCIGDVYSMGEIIVQVAAPRAPCIRIAQRYGIKQLDKFVGREGICGWYYRVLQEGKLKLGDPVTLHQRNEHTVTVQNLLRAVFNPDYAPLAHQYKDLEVVDKEWREKCRKIASKTPIQ